MSNMELGDAASVNRMIIAKAWSDPVFKAKLLADPDAALKEVGVAVVAGKKVKVVENADRHVHLVLPPMPDGNLSADQADKLSADSVA
jgi:hypothetical protein